VRPPGRSLYPEVLSGVAAANLGIASIAWGCLAALVACNHSRSSGGSSGSGRGGEAGAEGAGGAGGVPAQTTGGGGAAGAGAAGNGGAAAAGTACTVGAWPNADPAVAGPFATVTENDVGPAVGTGADGGAAVAFTLFRPADLAQGGLCRPVITWGNGTGTTPNVYRILLGHLASHGFVVIASNSPNVAQGDPPPMLAGVTWVLEQNADPTSAMYQRIDTTHIGATGHSQGGFATMTAGADARIVAIAPIAGATRSQSLHGPALLLCGGMDITVPCSMVMTAFGGINNQPVMFADQLAVDHVDWLTFRPGPLNPFEVAVTAWMRVHLMGDTALRPMFYGPSCALCQDTATWQVMQKMMDQ
jgi:hypothetical protein